MNTEEINKLLNEVSRDLRRLADDVELNLPKPEENKEQSNG